MDLVHLAHLTIVRVPRIHQVFSRTCHQVSRHARQRRILIWQEFILRFRPYEEYAVDVQLRRCITYLVFADATLKRAKGMPHRLRRDASRCLFARDLGDDARHETVVVICL